MEAATQRDAVHRLNGGGLFLFSAFSVRLCLELSMADVENVEEDDGKSLRYSRAPWETFWPQRGKHHKMQRALRGRFESESNVSLPLTYKLPGPTETAGVTMTLLL